MAKKMYAEFLGTFALIIFGVGPLLTGTADLLVAALASGLAVAVLIGAFAAISGAHFNPAVSFAMFITRRMNFRDFIAYIFAQLAGAGLAAFILKSIHPSAVDSATHLGTPELAVGVSAGKGLLVEIMVTFLLVTVIFWMAIDKRTLFGGSAHIAIGFTVALNILWAGPLTSAAMNPARWFGPALASGNWGNAWIWIAGPLVGATFAAFAYEALSKPAK